MFIDLGLRLTAVTLDCADVDRIAGFWSALLGLPLREPLPGWQRLGPVTGGPLLTFQPVGRRSSSQPTVHLDLTTADGPSAVARVLDLGGSLLEEHRYDEGVVRVAADPEGHTFCLVQYAEGLRSGVTGRAVAACPRRWRPSTSGGVYTSSTTSTR